MIAKRLTAVTAAVSLALLLAGCSAGAAASGAGNPTPPASSAPADSKAAPTLKLTAPTEGATVAAGDVSVQVATTDLEFVMPGNKNVAGQGHVHFTLDGGATQMSVEPGYTFKGVAAGTHKLRAELVQNNTEPFDPPVFEEITFEVK